MSERRPGLFVPPAFFPAPGGSEQAAWTGVSLNQVTQWMADDHDTAIVVSLTFRHRRDIAGIDADGPSAVHFAWAGGSTRGVPHYFRVQTRSLLIEMVNSVDNGDHIHSVIRDFDQDFAEAARRRHAAHVAEHGSHLDSRTTSSEGVELTTNDWTW